VEFKTIAEMQAEFGKSARTFRFWEGKGLISPRREGLQRLFSEHDCQRVRLILEYQDLGFSNSEIFSKLSVNDREVYVTPGEATRLIKRLEREVAPLMEKLARLRHHL